MLIRIYLAHRLNTSRGPDREHRYVNHVYFTYVSLRVGFAIIPALRSPNPALWIPIAVAGVLATGTLLQHRYQRRIGHPPAATRDAGFGASSKRTPNRPIDARQDRGSDQTDDVDSR